MLEVTGYVREFEVRLELIVNILHRAADMSAKIAS
jgi:hypothetical protein